MFISQCNTIWFGASDQLCLVAQLLGHIAMRLSWTLKCYIHKSFGCLYTVTLIMPLTLLIATWASPWGSVADRYRQTNINGCSFLTFNKSASFICEDNIQTVYTVGLVILRVVRISANIYRAYTLCQELYKHCLIKFSQQSSEVDEETEAQREKVTCPRLHN